MNLKINKYIFIVDLGSTDEKQSVTQNRLD